MRRVPKQLFRALGQVRDSHVLDERAKELGAENDKLRMSLHERLHSQEAELVDKAQKIAAEFDEKKWKRLERKLAKRIKLVSTGSLAAQCFAIERLEEARKLHTKALRSNKPASWHAVRIAVKKLRYTVESLLPELYETWSGNFKRLQDLLGEVHDLDVLANTVHQEAAQSAPPLEKEWRTMIERERDERLAGYRELTIGKKNVWQEWRKALPTGRRLATAATARLRVTARAANTHPQRVAHISRLATASLDALGCAQGSPAFRDGKLRKVLRASARMSGFKVKGGKKARQKAAHRFLSELPVPPSWTRKEWDLLAWTVRYQRGPEPKPDSAAFSKLPKELQMDVRGLAGLIRLARGLHKCGVTDSSGLRASKSSDAITLYVPGLPDSVETVAQLAVAKHLLESHLGMPLLLKPGSRSEAIVFLPAPEKERYLLANASD
jgi:hypothetical protein